MKIEYVYEAFQNLQSTNIYELLDLLKIEITYTPLLIAYKRDSMIICDGTRQMIFLRPMVDAGYREFLLWHEVGHYILHYHPHLKMNYRVSTYRELLEQEANLFAVFGLLVNEDLTDRRGIDAAVQKGVPPLVASDIFRLLYKHGYKLK